MDGGVSSTAVQFVPREHVENLVHLTGIGRTYGPG
jgi:hypothetical protein